MTDSRRFSFVHCADLHLDSPFEGIHALEPALAATLRDATFKAFDKVIDLAIGEGVDFIIIAGDVYDSADRSLWAQLRFRDALRRATEAGVECFVAHGNHDPLAGWEAGLKMPSGVHRFGGEGVEQITVRRKNEPLACVCGISYPIREVRQNLVPQFQRQDDDLFHIGVLHCNVGGDPSHDNYAPCSLEDLINARMDYWALGHIHNQKILRDSGPCIIYPGNTQGRSVRELGRRGCYLVRVDAYQRPHPEFVATDIVRWFSQEVDIADLYTFDDLQDRLAVILENIRTQAEGRGAILRLQLVGRSGLHGQLRQINPERDLALPLREGETERPDFVWVESVQTRTRPPLDIDLRRQVQDFVGDFLRAAEAIRQEPQPAALIHDLLTQKTEHYPIARYLKKLTKAELLAMLSDAETLGLDLLLKDEE
ncbi:MAG: DNA repair exonuclease [Deltaproteobacteria bacterium]|nr:DNA repair exonuclease [Deltaproteobacteria bacterium]MBW2134755.1 DNA repair exonuclease [Deltaproteobacteria bacterium]